MPPPPWKPPSCAAEPTTTSPPCANGRRPRSPASARRPRHASPLRKTALDGEMDQHGLVVESRVEQVGATVADYEAQMAAFFERLRAEEDPTRIAAMAERMPEPPDLAGIAAAIVEPVAQAPDVAEAELVADEPTVEDDGSEMTEAEASAEIGDAERRAEPRPRRPSRAAEQSMPDFAAAEAEAATFTGDVEERAGQRARPDPDRSRSRRRRAGRDRRRQPAAGRARHDPRDGDRPGQRGQHRHLQAQPGTRPGRLDHRCRVRPRRRVRVHRQSRRGHRPGRRDRGPPGLRGSSDSGSLRQPRGHRARPRRRLLTPPRIPKESHVARPAIAVALPLSESTTVSAELLAAGFEVIEIEASA